MMDMDGPMASPATLLCQSCGLCCTGHLFIWAKLRSVELDAAQSLGLNVFREPRQRGFSQPCPLWEGECTIYESPDYPRFCRTYKCKLLKELLDENIPLLEAMFVVRQAMEMIDELDMLLPDSPSANFRERLVVRMKQKDASSEFLLKAENLLKIYKTQFGVDDLVDKSEEEPGD